MSDLKAGIVIGALVVGLPVALVTMATVHFGYAKRGKAAAKAGLKIAKQVYWARLAAFVRIVMIVGLVLAIAWVVSKGPQR